MKRGEGQDRPDDIDNADRLKHVEDDDDEANLFAKDSSGIGSARVSGTLFSNVLMEENLSNPYSVGNTSNKISKDYCRQGGEYIY